MQQQVLRFPLGLFLIHPGHRFQFYRNPGHLYTLNLPDNFVMQADSTEIEIIFNNLLSNAVKYNKDDGEVFLTLIPEGGKLKIIVEDTGIGMSNEDTARLFKDFVRIKNKKTQNISGSGLGLSIMKKIVDLNEGTVEVESEIDKGSKFTVTINTNQ